MFIQVVKNRYTYFIISAVLFLISFLALILLPLNLGVDMTGGTQSEFSYNGEMNIEQVRTDTEKLSSEFIHEGKKVINNTEVYKVAGESKFVVVAGFDSNFDDKTTDTLKTEYKEKLSTLLESHNKDLVLDNYVNIGKSFGDYIKSTAIKTLIIAILAISLYLAYTFSGSVGGISSLFFAVITVITLLHDVVIPTGLYIITSFFFPEFKVDTFFITALLTVLGFSIADTIVILDRIRYNLKLHGGRTKDLATIVDESVNDTMTRSLYTSLTLFLVLISIFFFGPQTLRGFILAMIFGVLVGAYSSIFISATSLYELNKNKKLEAYKEEKDRKPEDKLVV
ncbi:MAG: protein translocase subunit SecF [Candidatus Gracilibacteria bacterium]|nr:protein translocase subunit SecF [Candidatus Gracilibacteria bacterium]